MGSLKQRVKWFTSLIGARPIKLIKVNSTCYGSAFYFSSPNPPPLPLPPPPAVGAKLFLIRLRNIWKRKRPRNLRAARVTVINACPWHVVRLSIGEPNARIITGGKLQAHPRNGSFLPRHRYQTSLIFARLKDRERRTRRNNRERFACDAETAAFLWRSWKRFNRNLRRLRCREEWLSISLRQRDRSPCLSKHSSTLNGTLARNGYENRATPFRNDSNFLVSPIGTILVTRRWYYR